MCSKIFGNFGAKGENIRRDNGQKSCSCSIDRIGWIAWSTTIPEDYNFNIYPKILQ